MSNNKAFSVKNDLELQGFEKAINKSAVRVFVYDTRNDSDGGAWRTKQQDKSWYNETLNTTYRGSRREFPVVAVIVAENNYVWIYDADTPDLEMWMGFYHPDSGTTMIGRGNINMTSVEMLNGVMAVGSTDGGSSYGTLALTDFTRDDGYIIFYDTYYWQTKIVDRNTSASTMTHFSGAGIINDHVTDLTMTVRPNTEVDKTTGLPFPTIGVATRGGVSVVRDPTKYPFITNKSGGHIVSITSHGDHYVTQNAGDAMTLFQWENIETAINYTVGSRGYNGNPSTYLYPHLFGNSGKAESIEGHTIAYTGSWGLQLIAEDVDEPRRGLHARITNAINTGWMPPNCRLATLVSTTDSNVSGSELVSNGDFSNGTTDWSLTGTGASFATSNGQLVITRDGTSAVARQTITTEVGKLYVLSCDLVGTSGGAQLGLELGSTSGPVSAVTKTHTVSHVATSTSTVIEINTYNTVSGTLTIDNVSVREGMHNYAGGGSKANPQIFGTVTVNPVATGSELVKFAGFNSSNYFRVPPTTELDFGSGDFCFSWWNNPTSTGDSSIFYLGPEPFQQNPSDGINVWTYGNALKIQCAGSGGSNHGSSTTGYQGLWAHCVFVRSGGTTTLYHNGIPVYSTDTTKGTLGSGYRLYIGEGYYNNAYSQIALFRVGKLAPTPEQVQRMYQDEKALFVPNSNITLSGSATYASAYDDGTGILHVANSGARDEITGLVRTGGTSAACGTVSARNGLVVEE